MKKILLLLMFVLFFTTLYPAKFPKLIGRVNDYANILNSQEESSLNLLLKELEDKTSAQVVLLTIETLDGDTIEDYAIRLTEQRDWKIGQKDLDNGVILLVSIRERKLRLEVGYGLEGTLTDLKSNYIIRKMIVPSFKSGDYYAGILRGLTMVSGIISKESDISPEDLKQFKKKKDETPSIPHIIFIIIFFFFILPSFFGKRRGGSSIFWGGGFGGGSSSGGGFGGFSGGGGSFGGGGASGGW